MLKEKREAFIESNLNMVHSICRRFTGKGIEYDDLFQAGSIGLIKAADAFDEERGFCFSTYAVPVIMGEIKRLFRDGGSVKVSRSIKELYLKINKEKQRLDQNLGREATVSEIAASLSVTAEEVTEAICALQPTVSLTVGEKGEIQTDIPCGSGIEEELSNKLDISAAMSRLNDDERKIIYYRYYRFLTQSDTASKLNMTQVQVSRAEKKILLKLKAFLE